MFKVFRKNKKSQDFQKLFKPNPQFVRRTGFLFLSSFSQKFGREIITAPRAFKYFIRGLAAGVSLMVIIGGGAVYADQTNVGPDNLLYPLKRAQEAVNLTFSSTEEKPILHLKLAERRLEEIEEVKQKDPSSEKLSGLSDDLRKELRNSLGALNGDEVQEDEFQEGSVRGAAESVDIRKELESKKAKEDRDEEKGPPSPNFVETSSIPGTSATSVQDLVQTLRKSLSRKQVFTEKTAPSICVSFRNLITSQNSEVREAIEDNSEFIEKYEKKCSPILREIQNPVINEAPGRSKPNQMEQEIQKVEENKDSSND